MRLSKQLRSLTSLALKIVAVRPISAAARHTAAVVPQPHPFASSSRDPSEKKVARCLDPVEVLIQLEGSGEPPSLSEPCFRTGCCGEAMLGAGFRVLVLSQT